MPGQTPESRVPTQILMQRRAIQTAFPKVDAVISSRPITANPASIELNVISSSAQPQESILVGSAFCETLCVYNPNTKSPATKAMRDALNSDIECSGVQPSGIATLKLPNTQLATEVVTQAPCGIQLESTGVPATLLGRIPDTIAEKPEIKTYPWYKPFGRFAQRVNSDYTANAELLTTAEIESINENTSKQARSLRAAVMSLASVSAGLSIAQSDALNLLITTGSLGAMAAFGSAWFGISFGNIREEFLGAAVKTTEKMLKPLLISMATTSSALIAGTYSTLAPRIAENPMSAFIAAPLILGPFGFAFLEGTKAIFQYDTSDLFSAGLTGEQLEVLKRQNQIYRALGIEPQMSAAEIRQSITTLRDSIGPVPQLAIS